MAPPDPDKALNAVRRIAANKVCGTCLHEERMGFKDVCMKFKIFICSDCKSCHQAFSHRCKVGRRRPPPPPYEHARGPRPTHPDRPSRLLQSVTMSNWSMAEVDVLRHENGGGNVVNASKIFARFPQGAKRPQKGCRSSEIR